MYHSEKPAISIIMPVYNGETYLEESINSALSQTLENIELICIDDGSKDMSLNILQSFKRNDGRIKIISQDNMGAGAARNAGLKAAVGDYIAFLDSDDLYPDEICLENIYTLATRQNAKIAGGSLLFLDKGKITKAVTGDADFTFSDTRLIKYKDFQQAYYYQRFIYSRDMLDKAGISFPEYRRFQDVVFFVKAMVEAGEFWTAEMPSYLYRKSNNYISLTDEQINDMLRGYIDVLTIARNHGFHKLFTFLAGRITAKPVGKMVKTSIESGNQTAAGLYPEVLSICKEKQGSTGFTGLLKSLFSGSK